MAKKKTQVVVRKKHTSSMIIVSCAVLVLCVVLLFGSYELKSRMSEKNAVIANLQEQIDQQIQESEQLLRESEYVKTEEYIEQIAREKLGLVKKNEIIFKKE